MRQKPVQTTLSQGVRLDHTFDPTRSGNREIFGQFTRARAGTAVALAYWQRVHLTQEVIDARRMHQLLRNLKGDQSCLYSENEMY
jgi:hypothetical protein